jgi:hypothetical protein
LGWPPFSASFAAIKKPVIRVWSDNRNRTRRVLSAGEQSGAKLILAVQKFGRAQPGKLEFIRKDAPRTEKRINRSPFRAAAFRAFSGFPRRFAPSIHR